MAYSSAPFASNQNIDIILGSNSVTFEEPVTFSSNIFNLGNQLNYGNLQVNGSNILLGANTTVPTTISFGCAQQPCQYLFYSPISATFSQIYCPAGLAYFGGTTEFATNVIMAGSNEFIWSSNMIMYAAPSATTNYQVMRVRNTDPVNTNSRISVGNIATSNFYTSEFHGFTLGSIETSPTNYERVVLGGNSNGGYWQYQNLGASNRPLMISSNAIFQPNAHTDFLGSVTISNITSNIGNAFFASNMVVAANITTNSLTNSNLLNNLGSVLVSGSQSNASTLSVVGNVNLAASLSNAGNLDCSATVCGHVGLTIGVQGTNGINIRPPTTTSLYTLTLPPSLPSPYQQHISYSAAGVGTAYATAFLGCYAPAIVSGNPANFYMSIGSVTTNSSGVWTYYNTTNNTSTGTSCTPNAVVSVNANPVNASGVVINTINSITTKVISGTCVLMAATTPLYNNALYSALANCTVYVQVSGY